MALQDILKISQKKKETELTEERVRAILPVARQYISYWREYPDMLVDFLAGKNSSFRFYFYQRVFLRVAMRHQYMYAVFPRK